MEDVLFFWHVSLQSRRFGEIEVCSSVVDFCKCW